MDNNTNEYSQTTQETTLNETEAKRLIKDYIERTKKSQEAVAKELGYTGSAISQFLSGTYPTPYKIILAVEQHHKITKKRQAVPEKPPFKMTSISQQVIDQISYCHISGEVGVVYGDPGIGKTMACENYRENYPDSILLTIYKPLSITAIDELMIKALNIRGVKPRNAFYELVNSLKGSNRVVIIDEAQHLSSGTINYLRSIVDACSNTIGMVFVGNDEIIARIADTQYQQVKSRMLAGGIEHAEAKNIKETDIKTVFDGAQLSDDSLKILHQISLLPWCGLRIAASVFVKTIIRYQLADYSEITAAKLAKTAKDMKVAVIMNG